jgi:hypothetical protein
MVDYEKETRATMSSRDQSGSSLHSSSSSIRESGEQPGRDVVEKEKAESLAKIQTARTQNGDPLQPTETREDGSEYPSGVKLVLISVALCLSVFLIALE